MGGARKWPENEATVVNLSPCSQATATWEDTAVLRNLAKLDLETRCMILCMRNKFSSLCMVGLVPRPFVHDNSRTASYSGKGFTKFTQLHVVTSQFVMFISCALRVRIEDGTGARLDSCEENLDLQLALVLRVVVLYL